MLRWWCRARPRPLYSLDFAVIMTNGCSIFRDQEQDDLCICLSVYLKKKYVIATTTSSSWWISTKHIEESFSWSVCLCFDLCCVCIKVKFNRTLTHLALDFCFRRWCAFTFIFENNLLFLFQMFGIISMFSKSGPALMCSLLMSSCGWMAWWMQADRFLKIDIK